MLIREGESVVGKRRGEEEEKRRKVENEMAREVAGRAKRLNEAVVGRLAGLDEFRFKDNEASSSRDKGR